MMACCGALVLISSGALVGIGAWLSGGGLTWLAGAAIAVAVGYLLWRRRAREDGTGATADGIGRADRDPPKETRPKA
jgi:hypothetical protein